MYVTIYMVCKECENRGYYFKSHHEAALPWTHDLDCAWDLQDVSCHSCGVTSHRSVEILH